MKPLKLEFQAFGPYKDCVCIDFERYDKDKTFLICGETGSGKTMILDAMTYALYGSKADGRNSIDDLRSNQAEFGTDTFVSFTFENNGETFVFKRLLECKRTNLSRKNIVYKLLPNGEKELPFENCTETKMNEYAEEIIGLKCDQFKQIIILPQGKFERFLTGGSSDKEAILSNIFGTKKWDEIANIFYDNAFEEHKKVSSLLEWINNKLQEYECVSREDFDRLIKIKSKELDDKEKEYKENNYQKQLDALNEDRELAKKHEELAKAKVVREGSVNNIKIKDLPNAEKRKNEAGALLEKHKENGKLIEEKKKDITLLESKRETYGDLKALQDKFKNAKLLFDSATKAYDKQNQICEALSKKLVKLSDEDSSLNQLYIEKQSLYTKGICGIISEELEDGKECPVCGSTHHPHKAVRIDGTPSKDELDRLEDKKNSKHNEWKSAEDTLTKEKASLEALLKDRSDREKDYILAEEKLNGSNKNKVDGIDTLAQLENNIKALQGEIEQYGKRLEALEKDNQAANDNLVTLKTKLEEAEKELKTATDDYSKANQELEKALAKNGFSSADELLNRIKEIEKADKDYISDHRSLCDYVDKLKETQKDIEEKSKEYNSKFAQATEDLELAKELKGQSGRIGLQTYVLAIMFNKVISEANEMLKTVHGGRYYLFRTDDKSGSSRSRGLNLKVHDSYSPDKDGRDVSSLSGGEKFLVSLSLAIGMSTVAQKSGIKIEAMFIDEGFGTLDESSIDDALGVLKGVQKANSLVGIISHVQVLRDNITQKIEVVKSQKGSTIKIS